MHSLLLRLICFHHCHIAWRCHIVILPHAFHTIWNASTSSSSWGEDVILLHHSLGWREYTVKKNPARTEKVEAFCDAFPACGHFYANVWICRHQRRFHWRPVRTLTFRPYDLTLQSLDVRAGLPMKRPWHQEVLPSILKFTETDLKSFSLGIFFSSSVVSLQTRRIKFQLSLPYTRPRVKRRQNCCRQMWTFKERFGTAAPSVATRQSGSEV